MTLLALGTPRRIHTQAGFDIEYYTSDACPNSQFMALLLRVRRKVQHGSMRCFLNALHDSNLLLQSKTKTFQMITGKISTSEEQLRAMLLRHAREDPAWMLQYGPAGDLPLHLMFLLGKRELGLDMLACLKDLDSDQQAAYWDQCRRLRDKFPDLEEVPGNNRDAQALVRWIVNLPYQSDISWWFKEVARRERVGAMHTYVCTCICMHVYINTYTYMYICTYVYIYIHTHTYINTYTYMYICIYVYIYTHTHTHSCRSVGAQGHGKL